MVDSGAVVRSSRISFNWAFVSPKNFVTFETLQNLYKRAGRAGGLPKSNSSLGNCVLVARVLCVSLSLVAEMARIRSPPLKTTTSPDFPHTHNGDRKKPSLTNAKGQETIVVEIKTKHPEQASFVSELLQCLPYSSSGPPVVWEPSW